MSRPTRPSVATFATATTAAVALWVSSGALTFVDTGSQAPYVGVLPSPLWLAAALGAAIAGVFVLARAGVSASDLSPLWWSAVLVAPWVPLPWPTAVLLWTGHIVGWVWALIVIALVARWIVRRPPAAVRRVAVLQPGRSALVSALAALAVYGGTAWATSPRHPSGDEPHYLIITQSLLEDHDLQIENNHRQRDYRAYVDVGLKPDFLNRGKNGEIYSIHAPGLPAAMAPFFAIGGYPLVVAALTMLAAAAAGLIWLVTWRVTASTAASWFAWAAVGLSLPYLALTGSVFPDGPGAALTLVGILPLVDERARRLQSLFWIGTALSALPWLHTRFAVIAACCGAVIVVRLIVEPDGWRRLIAFAIVPIVSLVSWIAFFEVVYGTPNPAAPYAGSHDMAIGNLTRGLPGILFDQQFGLLPAAPVLLLAALGLVSMFARGQRRLAVEIVVIVLPYTLVAMSFFMWWAGTSPPARFVVPVLLPLAIPIGVWWQRRSEPVRHAFGGGLLALTLLVSITTVLVDRGAFVFAFRDGASKLAQWLTPVVDMTRALPSLFQQPVPIAIGEAAIWLAAFAVAIAVASGVNRTSAARLLAFGLALEATATTATALTWRVNHASAATPGVGGVAVLSALSARPQAIGVSYRPFARLAIPKLQESLVIIRAAVPGRQEWPGASHVPAGTYDLAGTVVGPRAGRIRISTDRQSPPLAEFDVAELTAEWGGQLHLPVSISGLRVDFDDGAESAVRNVAVRAAALSRPVVDGEAAHAGRYGPALLFYMDGRAWVEPTGVWVGGGRTANFVIGRDTSAPLRVFLRNGPNQNHVTLASRGWHVDIALSPGEERLIDLPVASDAFPLDITAANGFRPSDVNPSATDDRYLGVWLETR